MREKKRTWPEVLVLVSLRQPGDRDNLVCGTMWLVRQRGVSLQWCWFCNQFRATMGDWWWLGIRVQVVETRLDIESLVSCFSIRVLFSAFKSVWVTLTNQFSGPTKNSAKSQWANDMLDLIVGLYWLVDAMVPNWTSRFNPFF